MECQLDTLPNLSTLPSLQNLTIGRFMWADLQIKNLCDNDRPHLPADIRAELGKLPKGLKETYSKIFHEISAYPDRSRLITMRALKWVMCAQRPLSPAELIVAISVDLDTNLPQPLPLDKETILRFCNNLVIWDRELDVVRFAHRSVQEFLEETSFKITEAHVMAAETCLRVLCLPNQLARHERGGWTKIDGQAESYYDEQWGHHIRICGQQPENSVITSFQRQFFHSSARPSKAYIEWTTRKELCYRAYGHPNYDIYHTPLFTAAHYGLTESVRYLMTTDISNPHPPSLQTALFIAASTGHEPVVNLLLSNRADPNHSNKSGETALLLASSGGHEPVVRLLLKNGADPHISDNDGNTALFLAAGEGHELVVQLLLDCGVNPNLLNKLGEPPLLIAARRGHNSVVQMLRKNVHPNASSNPTLLPGSTSRTGVLVPGLTA